MVIRAIIRQSLTLWNVISMGSMSLKCSFFTSSVLRVPLIESFMGKISFSSFFPPEIQNNMVEALVIDLDHTQKGLSK